MQSQLPPIEIYLETFDPIKVKETLKRYGVAVVKNHFTAEIADQWFYSIRAWLLYISGAPAKLQNIGQIDKAHLPNVAQLLGQVGKVKNSPNVAQLLGNVGKVNHLPRESDIEAWLTGANVPYGPRSGMMQSLVSHCPTVWNIREMFYPLYKSLWNEEKLLVSIDGATIHPYIQDDGEDWPHIDQTVIDTECIQGQVVLTDTTASFRCTPESNLHHVEILEMFSRVGNPSNWLKFNDKMVNQIRDNINLKYWQVPIHAPKGSVIFWNSNTIHSAKRNDKGDKSWRGVVYVSMRPAIQYNDQDRATLVQAAREGLTTNHWGTKIFSNKPGGHYHRRNDIIEKLTANPKLVALSKDQWSELLLKLTGQIDW